MELANPPKQYTIKGNLYCSCQYNVIFCTKYRRKVLIDDIATDLRTIIMDNQEAIGYNVLSLDISSDHVKMMVEATPEESINTIIGRIKAESAHILRNKYRVLRSRIPTLWTRVNFISTIGSVALADISAFLECQKKR